MASVGREWQVVAVVSVEVTPPELGVLEAGHAASQLGKSAQHVA